MSASVDAVIIVGRVGDSFASCVGVTSDSAFTRSVTTCVPITRRSASTSRPIPSNAMPMLRSVRRRPWLITIAANEARRQVRRERRYRVVAIDAVDVGSGDADPAGGVGGADLLAAFRQLSTEDRELLALRYVAGFDATELGSALGIPPSTVRTRLSRLIARLRTEIGE